MRRPEVMTDPELLETTELAFESALWFFHENNLFKIADKGVTDDVVLKLTKRINGGKHGLDDRIEQTNKIFRWLHV
jgi:putative chitinase